MIRKAALAPILYTLLALGLGACSDDPSPVGPFRPAEPTATSLQTSAKCDLIGDIRRGMQKFFARPARRAARPLVRDLAKACRAGKQTAVTIQATRLLAKMEALVDTGRAKSPTVGSRLAGRLLACTASLCRSSTVPNIDFSPALSNHGLFAVRFGSDRRPAAARRPVRFTDPDGQRNTVLWGVDVDRPWTKIMDANPVLVYGAPLARKGPPVTEAPFGAPAFELHRWPDSGDFAIDDQLHVGACFAKTFGVPHVNDDPNMPSRLERLQRDATLLSAHEPTFCPTDPAVASLGSALGSAVSSVLALAQTILPQPLFAFARSDRRVALVGGSPQSFSRFAVLGANTAGTLRFLSEPDPVVVEGKDVGVIRVQALSGAGTPVEKVKIRLAVRVNRGFRAGAFLTGDTKAFTAEQDGVATFEHIQVNKPGGYVVCATGTLDEFSFQPVCTSRFHARKHLRRGGTGRRRLIRPYL